jgi:hypothetical protein
VQLPVAWTVASAGTHAGCARGPVDGHQLLNLAPARRLAPSSEHHRQVRIVLSPRTPRMDMVIVQDAAMRASHCLVSSHETRRFSVATLSNGKALLFELGSFALPAFTPLAAAPPIARGRLLCANLEASWAE